MSNPSSTHADEFIDHAEVLATLDEAARWSGDRKRVLEILEKAALCRGLSHREAAILLDCNDPELCRLVHAADKLCAHIKCIEEQRAGNHEFDFALESIRASVEAIRLPEVQDFLRDYLPSFGMTLDELNHPTGVQTTGGNAE